MVNREKLEVGDVFDFPGGALNNQLSELVNLRNLHEFCYFDHNW